MVFFEDIMRSALLLSLALTLGTASMAAPPAPSSYSEDALKKKENEQKDNYFINRNDLPKVQAAVQGLGNETNIQMNQDRTIIDEEKVKGPSREEALKPVGEHARKAQEILQNEVKDAGIDKRNLGVDKLGKALLGEAGAPDSVGELAGRKADEDGRNAQGPNLDRKELQRIYGGSWAGGGA